MKKVSELMHQLSGEGKILLVTSHDYEFLMETCTHICYMKDGGIAEYFPIDESAAARTYHILFSE